MDAGQLPGSVSIHTDRGSAMLADSASGHTEDAEQSYAGDADSSEQTRPTELPGTQAGSHANLYDDDAMETYQKQVKGLVNLEDGAWPFVLVQVQRYTSSAQVTNSF